MKRYYFIFLLAMLSCSAFAQTDVREKLPVYTQDPKAVYRLFPTTNMYNFIELNTCTGQMNMVQWSTTSSNRGTYSLSSQKLVYSTNDEIPGRFTLYQTTNMYNYILLDTIDGRVWQVQWSFEADERMVLRIY